MPFRVSYLLLIKSYYYTIANAVISWIPHNLASISIYSSIDNE